MKTFAVDEKSVSGYIVCALASPILQFVKCRYAVPQTLRPRAGAASAENSGNVHRTFDNGVHS